MSRKSYLSDDPPLNKRVECSCPYVYPKKSDSRVVDAPVRCNFDDRPSHCGKCGWNPSVKMERIDKMTHNHLETEALMQQSDELTQQMLKGLACGRYQYV